MDDYTYGDHHQVSQHGRERIVDIEPGQKGKHAVSVAFSLVSACARLAGSGNYACRFRLLLFGVGFWLIMTFLLQGSLKRLKDVAYWGVIAIIFIIFLAFFLQQ